MKKILSIITLFLFLEVFFPSIIFAAPTCDPSQVDLSKASNGTKCNEASSQSDCNTVPDTIYCDAASVTTWIGATKCCYKKGVTKLSPTCPPGMIEPLSCSGICCNGNTPWSCSLKSGAPWLAIQSCSFIKQWAVSWSEKTYCTRLYSYESGMCVAKAPPPSLPWKLNGTTCKDISTNEEIVGFATAIGCVPTGNLQAFLKFVLIYAFVASGGIILLLIISTGYTLITSSGNPEKLQGAQENIVALFSGLALIAFSLVLLQTIGADILNLTAFK